MIILVFRRLTARHIILRKYASIAEGSLGKVKVAIEVCFFLLNCRIVKLSNELHSRTLLPFVQFRMQKIQHLLNYKSFQNKTTFKIYIIVDFVVWLRSVYVCINDGCGFVCVLYDGQRLVLCGCFSLSHINMYSTVYKVLYTCIDGQVDYYHSIHSD